jgi:hypothetical protein
MLLHIGTSCRPRWRCYRSRAFSARHGHAGWWPLALPALARFQFQFITSSTRVLSARAPPAHAVAKVEQRRHGHDRVPRALGCEPNFFRGPLPRRINRMRGEIAGGNVSCGTGAGVASIEAIADEAELKNASRMFRPTMPGAASKSRIGIFNFAFRFGLRGHSGPPAVSTL